MIADLIDLDDRTYADLTSEAVASIPSLSPLWTDQNESDPGIVLTEMFAWMTEMLCYRLNKVPEKNYWTFLQLINGPSWDRSTVPDLNTAIQQTITTLRDRDRAVNESDYEYLIKHKWPVDPATLEARGGKPLDDTDLVQRIRFLPEINRPADGSFPDATAPGHISVVLLTDGKNFAPSPVTLDPTYGVPAYLDVRRMLTTKVHLVNPRIASIQLTATVYLTSDANPTQVQADIVSGLNGLLDPFTGGFDGTGWPFGTNLYVSEVCAKMVAVTGVDYIENVSLGATYLDPITSTTQPLRALTDGVDLGGFEVLSLGDLSNLVLMQQVGNTWRRVTP
jgi:hypothetical protein